MSQSRGDEGQIHDLTDDQAGSPKARKRPAPEHRSPLQRGFWAFPSQASCQEDKASRRIVAAFQKRGEGEPISLSVANYSEAQYTPADAILPSACPHCEADGPSVLQIAIRGVQGDDARLDRVFKLCGGLYMHFQSISDPVLRVALTAGLARRFAAYDQPVLLMTFMLKSARRDEFLNQDCKFVSWPNACALAEELYQRFYPGASSEAAGTQLLAYYNKYNPFTPSESPLQIVTQEV